MKYRHCIFDIDGTLIDTESTGVLSLIKTVKELMGRGMSYEEMYPYFGIPSNSVAVLFDSPDHKEFEDRWEENFVAMSYLIKPFDGVEDILIEARKAGICLGVVTSRIKREIEHDPYLMKLLGYVDHVICAGDTKRPKPFPDPQYRYMELAAARLGEEVRKEDCIYFGDTEHDCQSAHSAGIDFAYADWRHRGEPSFKVEHRFHDAESLRDIILGD